MKRLLPLLTTAVILVNCNLHAETINSNGYEEYQKSRVIESAHQLEGYGAFLSVNNNNVVRVAFLASDFSLYLNDYQRILSNFPEDTKSLSVRVSSNEEIVPDELTEMLDKSFKDVFVNTKANICSKYTDVNTTKCNVIEIQFLK
ncbi:hypothetical protein L1267_17090 [Pseudoalteromonas sp. OFAV1]|jgi:hypothetical protein|uniref:hypothetical protein n=1 Tax=Pseudoalteromonas sp. OFAV1 TaxID=2908892 RepID=UPI001F335557|nr:hypothetical protein [Pseudoalteromonas sp. OFAV1]MCF2902094.1 hypothetical protein [Pseudoalteromonas sp. OFAV1]